jgi:hypothetical protein
MIFTEKLPRQSVKIIKHLLIVTIAVKNPQIFGEMHTTTILCQNVHDKGKS